MEDQGGTFGIIQLVLGALGLSGAGGGLLSAWTHWHSKRAEVAGNERKAKAERVTDLETENKSLREENRELRKAVRQRDDFIYRLRQLVPPPPPEWPSDWTHH